jgi:hypothetical protein
MLTKKEKLALLDKLQEIEGFQCAFEEEKAVDISYIEKGTIVIQRGKIKMWFDREYNYDNLIKRIDKII